ncbi:MAG: hypothetical protein LBG19_10620 [Prevotellaceae bacterium]|jgi:hypothetical protein|nr:hypothetical protein [Prevotellaceae bacterium]
MIEIIDNVFLHNDVLAILDVPSSKSLFNDEELSPVNIGNYKIAPWGEDNNLPAAVVEKAEASEVVNSNLLFNTQVCYGTGPKPMKRIIEKGKVVETVELFEGAEFDFFQDNDISLYLLEQMTDLNYFGNAFPEIILSGDRNKVVSLRSKSAVFSRWGVMDNKGAINWHYYSAKWKDNPSEKDIEKTFVLEEFNPLAELRNIIKARSQHTPRYIIPVYMPNPGRVYYPRPSWWSVFKSGWYDHAVMIPAIKNAISKNKLGVKFIIYISNKYLEDIFKTEGIDAGDKKAVSERINKEKTTLNDFLTGLKGSGKSLLTKKDLVASGNTAIPEKYIEIEPIKNDLSGGELIEDSEEVSNMLCYAMGIHPNLIGAIPGKGKGGSMSGTDKRELFMIKQALMKPFVDRVLRPFNLIKRFNNWDKNFFVGVPEFQFTTLDQNKSGKQVTLPQAT